MTAGWPRVPLGDLLTPIWREEEVDPSREYRLLGARWYAGGLFLKDVKSGQEIRADRLYRVQAGDFVYNRLFAWKGSFAVASDEADGCSVSNEFPCFEVDHTRLDGRFLWSYFRQEDTWTEALGLSSGATPTSRNRLKESLFLKMEIPLPSLPEQQRIVARIDELEERLRQARELRARSNEEANAILGSRAASLFEAMPVPQSVESVAEVRGGIQKGPHRLPGANPVRYLTVAHVQRNRISTDHPRFFEVTPSELERWRLVAGDVLIIEGNGSAEQIGRTALFRGEIADCVHQNHVIRMRPDPAVVSPEFLNMFLNSPSGQEAVQAESRSTSGLRTLSVGRIKAIRVPVPSIGEQRSVVEELVALQEQVAMVKTLQGETDAELDALLPAILDRAFRGEL